MRNEEFNYQAAKRARHKSPQAERSTTARVLRVTGGVTSTQLGGFLQQYTQFNAVEVDEDNTPNVFPAITASSISRPHLPQHTQHLPTIMPGYNPSGTSPFYSIAIPIVLSSLSSITKVNVGIPRGTEAMGRALATHNTLTDLTIRFGGEGADETTLHWPLALPSDTSTFRATTCEVLVLWETQGQQHWHTAHPLNNFRSRNAH